LKYVLFGDESTLPGMRKLFGSRAVLSVVASNRLQAAKAVDSSTIIQPRRTVAKHEEFISTLKAMRADVFLCFSYSMILSKEILVIPALGAINVHGGLLPRYRGANILNWAIIEGATKTGVTAHYMTEGIDEGDVIYSSETCIEDSDTALTLKSRLDELGLKLLARIDDDLCSGRTLPRAPQNAPEACRYRRRKPEDGLIDWEKMSDRQVFNLVRALVNPWPGAFTISPDGTRVVLDRYLPLEEIAALRARYGGKADCRAASNP
jgi:methionyl-tRNA formyltransferase